MTGPGLWRRGRRRPWAVAVTAAALALVGACGSDNSGARQDGGFLGHPANGSGSAAPASAPPGLLKAPPGTDAATLAAAAGVVKARLARMGVADAVVTAEAGGVTVRSSADAYQLAAAAQRHATTIAPIVATALGPCMGPGAAALGAATRCYQLGPAVPGAIPALNPAVQTASGAGWKLTFAIEPDRYAAFRAALATAGKGPLALMADGTVILAFGAGTPALQSAIGPPLAEEEARRAAAALVVDGDLPVILTAPPLPAPPAARVDADFWTAALGVKVCGAWLANAPASGLDTGVHSHGDGLVYVHPYNAKEAGDRATLGLYLDRGGWQATADRLKLWDGGEHRSGEPCPNGQPAQVRWWVDGVEQHGDPSTFTPRNGQVVVLSFDSDAGPPGDPPQMSALYLPPIGAAA